ncbi:hypothetical protein CC80DRAFT_253672 [Byssothecium circinans]|uniref:Secreted protein n=1 Tax=Byssothecium circinans TaxID=147558 RepID=A0A6A5TD64_9PLEO|nr:hypothetical protein CC80DRAFT_253672 [Byssothecium circinans]
MTRRRQLHTSMWVLRALVEAMSHGWMGKMVARGTEDWNAVPISFPMAGTDEASGARNGLHQQNAMLSWDKR